MPDYQYKTVSYLITKNPLVKYHIDDHGFEQYDEVLNHSGHTAAGNLTALFKIAMIRYFEDDRQFIRAENNLVVALIEQFNHILNKMQLDDVTPVSVNSCEYEYTAKDLLKVVERMVELEDELNSNDSDK